MNGDRDARVFQALLEASHDNIYVVDAGNRYRYVSRGGAAALGLTPEQMIGKTWQELGLDRMLMEVVVLQWQRVRETGQRIRHEVTFETPAGRRYFEYVMFPLLDLVGSVSRDVTERAVIAEQLRHTNERYRSFVQNSTEGIWRFELDEPIDTSLPADEQIERCFANGYLAECNDVMARMYGYEHAEDITGARLREMLDPDVESNRQFLRAFIENGYTLANAESVEYDRWGNRKYFMNSLTGVVEKDRILRAWGMQRDVTEMRDSRERLQALLAATTQTTWTAKADGQLTWIAASWEALTGQTAETARGSGWLEMIHPDDRQSAGMPFWREMPVRIRTREGTYRWYLVRAVPLRNPDGSVREWIGSNTDIDAQKHEEEQQILRRARAEFLAEANDLLARTLNYEATLRNLAQLAVPRLADWCAVDMVGPDGRLRRLAAEHLDPDMLRLAFEIQEKFPSLEIAPPRGTTGVVKTGKTEWIADIPDELLEASAQSAEHREMIHKLRLKSWIGVPIRVRDGVAGVLTLVNNEQSPRFTESDVQMAEELAARAGHAIENARLYQQAIEANRTKDEFLATLSHELRTPLTSILGWASLLRLSNYDHDTVVSASTAIEQSAKIQAALIDDLLDVSRIVTGKLQLNIVTIDAAVAIEMGVSAARPGAAAKRITITLDAPPSLPMRADMNRLQQIVWNLMSNAVKFSSEGSRIEVRLRKIDDRAVISIRDEGIGIEPSTLSRVFDRFWQADSSTLRKHGGLGLGLSIVKYLAELHGGTANAHSEGVGKGATFVVSLPLGVATTAESREAPADAPRGRRVLLVDDDGAARNVVERTLEHFGANVVSTPTAAEAVQMLERYPFDLVLTDIAMPEHDGYWLLAEVRRRYPSLRVAAITALGQSDAQIAGAGFDSYLRKPVDPEALAKLLEESAVSGER